MAFLAAISIFAAFNLNSGVARNYGEEKRKVHRTIALRVKAISNQLEATKKPPKTTQKLPKNTPNLKNAQLIRARLFARDKKIN